MITSSAPGTLRSSFSTELASLRVAWKSSPYTLTTRSLCAPASLSSTPVDHRLREADVGARQLLVARRQLVDQVLLAHAGRPFVIRLQGHRAFDMRRRERIGAFVIAAQLRDHVRDLRFLQGGVAQRVRHLRRLGQRNARR